MKSGLKYFVFIGLALSLFACSKKMSEKEYYVLATQNMEKENYAEAEKYFAKILEEYPNGANSSKAMFMVAFINANYLKNMEKAREYYSNFIEKYPNHELAQSAQYELQHLGQNIDELPFLKDETGNAASGDNKQTSDNSSK